MAWRSLTRVPPVEIGWARCWLLKLRSASLPVDIISCQKSPVLKLPGIHLNFSTTLLKGLPF